MTAVSFRPESAVLALFIAFLILGVSIAGQFGVSWDEIPQRMAYEGIFREVLSGQTAPAPICFTYQFFLYVGEKLFGAHEPPKTLIVRHILNFLFFYLGLIFFYFLCKKRFRNWGMGLLGVFLIVISPRIFAQSFYNPKDIPIMTLFIIGACSFMYALEKKSVLSVVIHAGVTGFLYNNTPLGLILAGITVVMYCREIAAAFFRKESALRLVLSVLMYCSLLALLLSIIRPDAVLNPVFHFKWRILSHIRFDHNDPVLFMGRWYVPRDLPWFYTIAWILISTPLTIIALFGAGITRYFFRKQDGPRNMPSLDVFSILMILLSLGLPILCRSNLYDSWRHHYFIYPFVIIIALKGFERLLEGARNAWRRSALHSSAVIAVLALIIADLGSTGLFIARNYPHADVYFNALTGGIRGAEGKFDLDYWGVSYRKGYEYIVENNKYGEIMTAVDNYAGRIGVWMLPEKERDRILIVNYPVKSLYHLQGKDVYMRPKYLLTNYRWREEKYDYKEAFSVKVDGVKILYVYELT